MDGMTTTSHLATTKEPAQIQSLVRAFSILEAIARSPSGINLADISRSVGLHKSTAFRMVRTLTTLGYVRSDARKLYHVSDRLQPSRAAD
jgi:IclR family transcriptional regulator, acetate operon repressor